jgi:hypothetical protein
MNLRGSLHFLRDHPSCGDLPIMRMQAQHFWEWGMSISQSHITSDGKSAIQSWCQAPTGAKDQIFVTVSCDFVDVGRPL